MEIRLLYSKKDAEKYLKLRLESLLKNPEAFAASYEEETVRTAEHYERIFNSKNSFTIGAFRGQQLVGMVTIVPETRQKLKHRANLVAMFVSEEVRGLGVGSQLVKQAIDQAKEEGDIEQIYLSVVSTNERAKKLYTSFGFEAYATERKAMKIDNAYVDEILMVLML